MSNPEKQDYILEDMAKNYNEFLKQAKYKLIKQRSIVSTDAYRELVSDITFSIIEKFTNVNHLNRFYEMAKANKLKLFIFKAIDSNTRFYSAPFLRKKMKEINRISYVDHFDNAIAETEPDEDEERINAILDALEPEHAKAILGEQWEYYVIIFKEYIYNKTTYKKIASKYGIPQSGIYFHIRWMKERIRESLSN